MHSLLCVIRKEFQQLRRDKKMIPMVFISPLIQIFIFGFAANNDVTDVPFVLVDRDRTTQSRDLMHRFEASGYFHLVENLESVEEVEPYLVTGEAQIALVVSRGYGKELLTGRSPAVQVIADGSDSTSAIQGLNYASRILETVGLQVVTRRNSVGDSSARIELKPRAWYNPDLKSRVFYLPAILAMVLILTTMVLPSMAIVREKEIGTMEQIIVTPLRPWQLITGKLVPFLVIGFLNVLFLTLLIVLLFQVSVRGSFLLLLLLSLPFILTTLGLGLLVSTLVQTQQQAMLAAMYMVMVPMVYLSGLVFPIENMPAVIQKVTYAIPLRYYAIILRGIFLKGADLKVLFPQAAALSAIGLGVLFLASTRFRKTLD